MCQHRQNLKTEQAACISILFVDVFNKSESHIAVDICRIFSPFHFIQLHSFHFCMYPSLTPPCSFLTGPSATANALRFIELYQRWEFVLMVWVAKLFFSLHQREHMATNTELAHNLHEREAGLRRKLSHKEKQRDDFR